MQRHLTSPVLSATTTGKGGVSSKVCAKKTGNLFGFPARCAAGWAAIVLLCSGSDIAFIISPLFLASKSYIWSWGLVIVAIGIIYIYIRKRGYSMKATNRVYYLSALVLQGIALVLEILPANCGKSARIIFLA